MFRKKCQMVENQSLPSAPDVRWEFRLSLPRPKAHFSDVDFWGRGEGKKKRKPDDACFDVGGEKEKIFHLPFLHLTFLLLLAATGGGKTVDQISGAAAEKKG